jgi:signal transduction histidine kinase
MSVRRHVKSLLPTGADLVSTRLWATVGRRFRISQVIPSRSSPLHGHPLYWLALVVVLLGHRGLEAYFPVAKGQSTAATGMMNGASGLLQRGRPALRLELEGANVVLTGQFPPGTAAQTELFNHPVSGRYFCLETLSAQDGRPYAAVAELDLLDGGGKVMNRTGWKIAYVDSEEHEREDGSAENALDDNPSTYWHTQWSTGSPNHPHHLVVDLGKTCTVAGFRYLPRPGDGAAGGRIKDYRIYVGDNLLADNAPDKVLPAKCYLHAYFTGDGRDGLHLDYSLNGYRWDELNGGHSVLAAEVGDKIIRDPSLILAPDGLFHLVWTAGWSGNYIGYASSPDLIHWSKQVAIPVMGDFPGALNCWAPEIFWEADKGDFLIFWASTVAKSSEGKRGQANNNRIYYTTTKDFQTFAPTKLLYDPGYSIVDAMLLAVNERYYLIFQDTLVNHLRMAVGEKATGPFGPPGSTFEADYAEGPMAFQLGNQVVIGYHLIAQSRSGAVRTSDMVHWEDISAGIFLPLASGPGEILEVAGEKLNPLVQAGVLETGTTPEASELGIGDWIWTTNATDRQACHLWRSFDIPAYTQVVRADLRMTADNSYTVFLDGLQIGSGGDANSLAEYDLTWLMSPGHHVLAVDAFNDTLDAGVILGMQVKLANGKKIEVFSDPSWRVVTGNDHNWHWRKQADETWPAAQVVGYAGKVWWQYPFKIVQVPPLQPPVVHLWQQGWVLAVLLGACLTIAVLCVRLGLRLALQSRARRLLERERERIARDIHDDLGSGLTQLTLLGELALRETPGEGEMRQRLNELCTKARTLLQSMDEIVWAVNPRRDTVKDFAAFILEHAQEYLATTAIHCRQEVAEELPAIPLDLPQRRNLMLAVKEAVRNAARHSGAEVVRLKVEVVERSLTVVVEDNGKGFSAVEIRPGRNGMTNMQQRLADIGGSFTLTTKAGKGCRVVFSLPLPGGETILKSNHEQEFPPRFRDD